MVSKEEKMVLMYREGKSIKEISKETEYSYSTVRDFLMYNGVEFRLCYNNRLAIDDEIVINEYTSGKSLKEVPEIFGCSPNTVGNILKRNKIERRQIGARKKYDDREIEEMKEMYSSGMSSTCIAKVFGCEANTVLVILRENGVHIRRNKISLSESDIETAVNMYDNGKSSNEIATKLGCKYRTVLKALRYRGVKIRGRN